MYVIKKYNLLFYFIIIAKITTYFLYVNPECNKSKYI